MELYATGFNAHTQLLSSSLPPIPSSSPSPSLPPSPPSDLLLFQKIASATTSIRVLCALWSTTVLEIDDQLCLNGFHETRIYHNELITGQLRARDVKTVFGDAGNGVLGALSREGRLWRLVEVEVEREVEREEDGGEEEEKNTRKGLGFLEWEGEEGSWLREMMEGKEKGKGEAEEEDERRGLIDQVAIAENGQVCVVVAIYPNSPSSNIPQSSSSSPPLSPTTTTTTTLQTFPSISALLHSPTPQSTHSLPSPPTTFLASSTSFTSLHPSQLLTWGSPLHSHLGRTLTAETPASSPGPVLALGGIPIRKVAARGWMTAALSRDHELYVWGGRPEERAKMEVLRMREGEEVALVEDVGRGGLEGSRRGGDLVGGFDGGREDEVEEEEDEEEGILDVGVGESHILVLTTRGKVYAVGEGKWGQLGTGKRNFESGWVEVSVPVPVPVPALDDAMRRSSDIDDDSAIAEEENSMRDHPSASGPRGPQQRKRKIIGVECGLWNSFLLVSLH